MTDPLADALMAAGVAYVWEGDPDESLTGRWEHLARAAREHIDNEIDAARSEYGCEGLYCDGVREGFRLASRIARGQS
jgi:hypothetical protein